MIDRGDGKFRAKGDLTLTSWNLRNMEDDADRTAYIKEVRAACEKRGVTLILQRSDGLKLSDEDEALFDEVYCNHDRKVVKSRSTLDRVRNEQTTSVEVVIPPKRRRPV